MSDKNIKKPSTITPPPSWFAKDGSFDIDAIRRGFNLSGHTKFLGMEFSGIGSSGNNLSGAGDETQQSQEWLELYIDWREELVADEQSGVMASAAIISLLDNATSLAIFAKMRAFKPQATMDMRVDYMRASPKGARVYGRGECYKLTSKIAFMRGTAHNGDIDDPIAYVTGSFIQTSLSSFVGGMKK